MQDIVLDHIKFPTGEEKDGARFRQIQEERLNRNFRRLLEMTFEAGLGTEYKQVIDSIQSDVADMQETIATQAETIEDLSDTVSEHTTELADIGHYYSAAPVAVSLAASTWKTTASLALPAGKYIVAGTCRFAGNSTGRRMCLLSTSQNSSSYLGIIYVDTVKGFSDGSGFNFAHFCAPLQLGSANTVYLNAWQNSGSALETYGRLYAMKLA